MEGTASRTGEGRMRPRTRPGLRAALVTLGPLAFVLSETLRASMPEPLPSWWPVAALLASVAISIGGAVLDVVPTLARLVVLAGLVGVPGLALPVLLASPGFSLLTLLLIGAIATALGEDPTPPTVYHAALPPAWPVAATPSGARWSAVVALITWFLVGPVGIARTTAAWIAAALALVMAATFGLAWLARDVSAPRGLRRALLATAVGSVVLGAVLVAFPKAALTALAIPSVISIAFARVRGTAPVPAPAGAATWWSATLEHPARLLVITFFGLCTLSTMVLGLPVATEPGHGIEMIDAAFTAVSAICVTGLTVVDTPATFTAFGEAAILVSIQVGGIGIMTFYSTALILLGRRMSLRHESAVAGVLAIEEERGRLLGALTRVLTVTFTFEAIGAVVLATAFAIRGDELPTAIWRGVFHSVSAFCNAGFALQTDSLVPYAESPVILHTIALLIIAGGLSPGAIVAVPLLARGQRIVPLQIRLILATTVVLLFVAFASMAAFEWTNTLRHMTYVDRLHNAWFQAVTLRTAGFNSIDIAATRPVTHTLMIAMMFIGGSPGGTAGGVKTTTAAVLAVAVVAAMRARSEATIFGRRVGHVTVYKAAAVLTMGVLTAVGALITIQLTQDLRLDSAIFEVISAIGTVGLTLGATMQLDSVGKVLIMLCMFAGRVGPLTLFLFLTERRIESRWAYPQEEVDVG